MTDRLEEIYHGFVMLVIITSLAIMVLKALGVNI